jgi:hypothetical protein
MFRFVVVQVNAENIILLAQLGVHQDALCAIEDTKGIGIAIGFVGMMFQRKFAVILFDGVCVKVRSCERLMLDVGVTGATATAIVRGHL